MIQENPQYFPPQRELQQTAAWDNWDQALIFLGGVAVFILILVVIKLVFKKR